MKILYFDFDGALHNERVYFHPKHGIYMATPRHALFEWMPMLDELLMPHSDVKVVLSTSWVPVRSFSFAKSKLSPTLQRRVVGATFHNRVMSRREFFCKPRGVQIAEDVMRRNPESWFALDDDWVGWPEERRCHLITTDGNVGISTPEIQNEVRLKLESFW